MRRNQLITFLALCLSTTFCTSLFAQGDPRESYLKAKAKAEIDHYSNLIKEDPGDKAALLHRAESYTDIKDYPAASGDYAKVLQLEPCNLEALNGRAVMLQKASESALAIKDLDAAEKCDATFQLTFVNRVRYFLKVGDAKAAQKELDKLKALPEGDYLLDTAKLQGLIYMKEEKYVDAAKQLQAAFEYDSKNPEIILNHGICLMKIGEYQAAVSELSVVVMRSVDDQPEAYYYLFECNKALNDKSAACYNLEQSIKTGKSRSGAQAEFDSFCK